MRAPPIPFSSWIRLEHTSTSMKFEIPESKGPVNCDECDETVKRYLQCPKCQFGQFDLCKPCVDAGHWCLDTTHQMVELEDLTKLGRHTFTANRPPLGGTVSKHYRYDPLPAAKDTALSLRLLTLHPLKANEASDVKADIQAYPMHQVPEYEALSYVWGPTEPVCFMQLNGKKLAITPSLHSALHHIAMSRETTQTLWVDAVCINQRDDIEKADQVSRMREIYEGAQRAIVWLGPATEDTRLALTMCLRMLDLHGRNFFGQLMGEQLFEEFEKMVGKPNEDAAVIEGRRLLYLRERVRCWSDHGNNLAPADVEEIAKSVAQADMTTRPSGTGAQAYIGSFTDYMYSTPPPPTTLDQVKIPNEYRIPSILQLFRNLAPPSTIDKPLREEVTAVSELFSHPWFSRVWTVQETVFAKDMVFFHAGDRIPGWAVYAGLRIARDYEPTLTLPLQGFDLVWIYRRQLCRHESHNHDKHKGKRELISLLRSFRQRHATNPHDKVYALLGLTSDDYEALGASIRYDRPVAETYTETAIAIINATRDLSLLSFLKNNSKPTPGLPSWVPDWGDTTMPLSWLRGEGDANGLQQPTMELYTASSGVAGAPFKATPEGGLRPSGYLFDIIVESGPSMLSLDAAMDIYHKVSGPCRMDTMRAKAEEVKRSCAMTLESLRTYLAWEQMIGLRESEFAAPSRSGPYDVASYKETLQTGPNIPSDATEDAFNTWRANLTESCEVLSKIVQWPTSTIFGEGRNATFSPRSFEFFTFAQKLGTLGLEVHFACAHGRRLVRTADGRLGLAPHGTQMGDSVALVKGSRTPVVVRECDRKWTMVGPAYIHGVMYGEAWREEDCQEMIFI